MSVQKYVRPVSDKITVRATLVSPTGNIVHYEDIRYNPDENDEGFGARAAINRLLRSVNPYPGDTIEIKVIELAKGE
jgi:hypothetical protein